MRIVTTSRAADVHPRSRAARYGCGSIRIAGSSAPTSGSKRIPSRRDSSRRTKFTRASRRPHGFRRIEQDGLVVNYDFGNMAEPEELHLDRKGWRKGTYRLEAYWNGSVFVGDDIPPPVTP